VTIAREAPRGRQFRAASGIRRRRDAALEKLQQNRSSPNCKWRNVLARAAFYPPEEWLLVRSDAGCPYFNAPIPGVHWSSTPRSSLSARAGVAGF
jgi:hypothetical protein